MLPNLLLPEFTLTTTAINEFGDLIEFDKQGRPVKVFRADGFAFILYYYTTIEQSQPSALLVSDGLTIACDDRNPSDLVFTFREFAATWLPKSRIVLNSSSWPQVEATMLDGEQVLLSLESAVSALLSAAVERADKSEKAAA